MSSRAGEGVSIHADMTLQYTYGAKHILRCMLIAFMLPQQYVGAMLGGSDAVEARETRSHA